MAETYTGQVQNGVVVFASSTGNQLSQEDDAWKNGAELWIFEAEVFGEGRSGG
jgi:hypothetical protein